MTKFGIEVDVAIMFQEGCGEIPTSGVHELGVIRFGKDEIHLNSPIAGSEDYPQERLGSDVGVLQVDTFPAHSDGDQQSFFDFSPGGGGTEQANGVVIGIGGTGSCFEGGDFLRLGLYLVGTGKVGEVDVGEIENSCRYIYLFYNLVNYKPFLL